MPNDATSEWESVVDEGALELKHIINEIGPEAINRALFSSKIPKKQQFADYEQLSTDRNAIFALWQERAAITGPSRALKELVGWFKEMEGMRGITLIPDEEESLNNGG